MFRKMPSTWPITLRHRGCALEESHAESPVHILEGLVFVAVDDGRLSDHARFLLAALHRTG
jgi:hypothetical protein